MLKTCSRSITCVNQVISTAYNKGSTAENVVPLRHGETPAAGCEAGSHQPMVHSHVAAPSADTASTHYHYWKLLAHGH